MVINTYNPNFAFYLQNVVRTEFAVGPQNGNGNGEKKAFEIEREKRNVYFSKIIQTSIRREEKLTEKIRRLEERARKEIGSSAPEGYTPWGVVHEYKTKIQSARNKLSGYRATRAQAEQGLSQSALLLVVNIASYFAKKYQIPSDDLIGDGNLGLMRAAKKFEGDRGFQFSTYATWWIRQSISKGLLEEQRKYLNTPFPILSKRRKLTRIEDRLTVEFEREPTDEEITNAYNEIFEEDSDGEVKLEAVKALRQSKQVLSLSRKLSGIERTFDAEDKGVKNPAEEVQEREEFQREYQGVMDYLNNGDFNYNERTIIMHRFGLEGKRAKTLEETGRVLKLTRERIRQIEARAMRKLKGHFNP